MKETTDILNEEDEKLLRFIQTFKNNINSLIGGELLIDKMRNIINNSEHFSFRSKRNEKLISLSKPLFVLTFDQNKISKELDYKFDNSNKDIIFLQKLIQQEITSIFSQFLSEKIRDKEFMKKILDKYNITNISEDELILLSFVTASIFSINIDLKTKLVYLEFVI